jgi:hypothetical protein
MASKMVMKLQLIAVGADNVSHVLLLVNPLVVVVFAILIVKVDVVHLVYVSRVSIVYKMEMKVMFFQCGQSLSQVRHLQKQKELL